MNTMIKTSSMIGMAALGLMLTAGCAGPAYQARQSEMNSAIAGGVLGGVIGGIVGNNVGDGDNQVLGAAIGTATGAWAGQQYGQGQDQVRHRLQSLEAQAQTETIMVANQNGSWTPVTLHRVGYGQYRGPRGEIYTARPTEDQLRIGYGF